MKIQINENTKVTINLVILCSLLIFVLTASAWAATYKTQTESRIADLEKVSKENSQLSEANSLRLNSQDVDLAEIKTDLKWIRAFLEGEESP